MKNKLFKILIIPILFFVFTDFSFASNMKLDWAKGIGNSNSEIIMRGKNFIDNSGNIYSTGYFSGTVDFDPGAGTTELVSNGGNDIYLLKLDSDGDFVWVKQIGGTGSDEGKMVYLDSTSQNIFIAGSFSSTVDFDPGAGTTNLTSAGIIDAFILKLDSNGDFVWVKKIGGTSNDWVANVTVDSDGNVYSTGTFVGAAVDFDPGAGTTNLSAGSSEGSFVQKLDSNGDFVWAKSFSGNTWGNWPGVIKVTSDGSVYTGGTFRGTTDFDPGAGTSSLTSNGTYDGFLSKLDSSGNFVWIKRIGGNSTDFVNTIDFDSDGNLYIGSGISSTDAVDFDPGAGTTTLTSYGSQDIFVTKLDSNGDFVWVKQVGNTGNESIINIYIDSSDYMYITGLFSSTVDFDPGAGTTNLTSIGSGDAYILKLNSDGEFVWVEQFGGTGNDEGYSILVDSSGNIVVMGLFTLTGDFDINAGTTELTSAGGNDVFIIKITPDSTNPTISSVGASNIENTSSIITWSTNENATTQVEYGIDTNYGTSTTEADTGTGVTSHTVSLTGLTPCRNYNYRVTSKDVVDNSTTSSNYTFTTPGCAAVPVFILQAMSDAMRTQSNVSTNVPPASNTNTVVLCEGNSIFNPNTGEKCTTNTNTNTKFIFTKNLKYKDNNTDVKELQKFLNNNGYPVSTSGIGSIGNETTYFGPATRSALIKYQLANKIKPAIGYFGPLTRSLVNK